MDYEPGDHEEVNPRLRAQFLDIVENQLRDNDPPETLETLERLMLEGISEEDAISMIVNGFCKDVFRKLPMEFAVEAQALLGVSLEGAVG